MREDNETYNGFPVFDVGLDDFLLVTNALTFGWRLLSRKIRDGKLKEFYCRSRHPEFIVRYNGIMIRWIGGKASC